MIDRSLSRGFAAAALCALAALLTACGNDGGQDAVPRSRDAASNPTGPQVAQAAAAAKSLGGRLKARLVESMQAEGPVAAIEVCKVEAPAIAADVSASSGLDVGRTSLRVRNPANRPGPRERDVLERWSEAVAAGTPVSDLAVHVETGEDFLWMKPIAVEGPCLACHGETLAEPVATAIAARYREDRATGYALGDLRGAFVVRAADSGN